MLRRGIPFGELFDHSDAAAPGNKKDRGLLFVAYQRSPALQFETLNTQWMNSEKVPTPNSFGFDLLVGQHLDANRRYDVKEADFYEGKDAPPVRFSGLNQWVFPTGGAYLFAPSLSLLKHLAGAAVSQWPTAAIVPA